MTNRRNFLKCASLLAFGGIASGKMQAAHAAVPATDSVMASKRIGLQIYSLGGDLYKDLPANLMKLGKMGYKTLELAGYNSGKVSNVDMMEFKKMANDAGLKIISSHVNPPVHEYTKQNIGSIMDFWKATADDHAKLETPYLVQPGQPSTRSVEEVAYVCEVFNKAGQIMKDAGIAFGYHNHDMEFSKVTPGGNASVFGRNSGSKGEKIYDLFLKNTDPALVLFEMDVYWTVMGQCDPVEYMQQYPDRIKLLHIKDRAVLGDSGMMNFESIFKQAYANGIKDYFVELEGMPSGRTQFDGVKGCADYLLGARFVK